MTKVVWKYPLEIGETTIEMPKGANILCVQSQHDIVCLWASVTPNSEFPKEVRHFKIYGTGQSITSNIRRKYIGTAQTHFGNSVWHIFEVSSN